eukprot:TRINITY_DN4093_c0_g1_i20.p2 TRINITY_DN4093_c0_g1~~TRINITY_DN4093_c0_g1_i20.p2  ORF type:complete len:235 (-),score=54.61 TRINITY_DN4093_c0_g1_i20:92-796(-)
MGMELSSDSIKVTLGKMAAETACCDCSALYPTYASINNGVFLCESCASLHKTFGEQFSYVRSITRDEWNHTCYLYMQLGGNAKFKELLMGYSLLAEPAPVRYKTRAAEYYRMRLYSLVQGTSFTTPPPSQQEAKVLLDEVNAVPGEEPVGGEKQEISAKIASGAQKAGAVVYSKGKVAVNYISQKGKEIAANPTVQKVAQKAKEGIIKAADTIGDVVSNFVKGFSSEKDKDGPK